MRVLLAAVLVLAAAVLLAACGSEEEKEPTATPTPTASAAATGIAPPTSGTAAVSPTPRRDAFRRGTLTPTVRAIATATARATATPRTTPVPTVAPTQTQAALPPSWQTSAPREPVSAGTTVELGIRNENGAPGETYAVAVLVRLPDQRDIVQEGQVSGDAWTNFYISDTTQAGTYKVIFGLPQSDYIYAEDSFEVAGGGPPPGGDVTSLTWQVSAPRQPIALGDTAELGLRNKWGSPGECYDFVVEVLDPESTYASGEDTVCADEWTYLNYSDTWVAGTYSVYYSIQEQIVATDSFEVSW